MVIVSPNDLVSDEKKQSFWDSRSKPPYENILEKGIFSGLTISSHFHYFSSIELPTMSSMMGSSDNCSSRHSIMKTEPMEVLSQIYILLIAGTSQRKKRNEKRYSSIPSETPQMIKIPTISSCETRKDSSLSMKVWNSYFPTRLSESDGTIPMYSPLRHSASEVLRFV